MAYLSCPTCGLSFRVQALDLVIEKCPRCLARAGRVTKLLVSEAPQIFSRKARAADAVIADALAADALAVEPAASERDVAAERDGV